MIMKKTTLCTAIVSSLLSAGVVHAAPTFDANFELNTDATDQNVGDTTFDQNGRVELNVYGKHTSGDNYIVGKASPLLNTDGETTVDDAYLQIGNSTWDVQLGRFEATNLFPKGKDTLIVHAIDDSVYEANLARGRVGDDGGQIALHFNASESLKFEIGTVYGDDDKATPDPDSSDARVTLPGGDNKTAFSAIRPLAVLKTSAGTFTAGLESVKYDKTSGSDVDRIGYALTANFDISGASVNVSASHLKDKNSDQKITTFGTNMTYGNFGLGLIASDVDNAGSAADPSVMTTYIAYSVPVFDIENAKVTFAGSYSKADDVAVGTNDKTLATRVRINYDF